MGMFFLLSLNNQPCYNDYFLQTLHLLCFFFRGNDDFCCVLENPQRDYYGCSMNQLYECVNSCDDNPLSPLVLLKVMSIS